MAKLVHEILGNFSMVGCKSMKQFVFYGKHTLCRTGKYEALPSRACNKPDMALDSNNSGISANNFENPIYWGHVGLLA